MKKIKVASFVQDKDCPKCGFPETVTIRNIKTGEVLGERCSKFQCPDKYFVLYDLSQRLH